MRSLVLLGVLGVVAACTTEPTSLPPPDEAPTTVRAALAAGGVELVIAPDPGAGSVVARQWRGQWEEGTLTIRVDGGVLALSADRDGALVVDDLEVALAPIALPDAVFGEPARLTELRLGLVEAAPARATWDGPDAGRATVTATLALAWSLETQGRVTPLGPVTLRGLPLALDVGGAAAEVTADVGLRVDGAVWTWAGLVELRDLALAVRAAP